MNTPAHHIIPVEKDIEYKPNTVFSNPSKQESYEAWVRNS